MPREFHAALCKIVIIINVINAESGETFGEARQDREEDEREKEGNGRKFQGHPLGRALNDTLSPLTLLALCAR